MGKVFLLTVPRWLLCCDSSLFMRLWFPFLVSISFSASGWLCFVLGFVTVAFSGYLHLYFCGCVHCSQGLIILESIHSYPCTVFQPGLLSTPTDLTHYTLKSAAIIFSCSRCNNRTMNSTLLATYCNHIQYSRFVYS